jgi:alkanesulfonate monooxygenase SsuD/methylene tetrahydromethanopterin reductase-like flavin-dependent oxidoreductase (luciferase family)
MNCGLCLSSALAFGSCGRGSLRQQHGGRLEIASACDEAGFRAYHIAEHHENGSEFCEFESGSQSRDLRAYRGE